MNILYLTFYFRPDLCAGSFRNSPLAQLLAEKAPEATHIDVITTVPNRYESFSADAPAIEELEGITIYRILIPPHKSGFLDQIKSFIKFFFIALRIARRRRYKLVFASSSRLFTAFLGKVIALKSSSFLYLDIRDIFTDTMNEVLKSKGLKLFLMPVLNLIEKFTFSKANHINLVSEGFKSYFAKYSRPSYSFFTNGIDQEFLDLEGINNPTETLRKTITYAGNIGEGQGLEKIVPLAAKQLPDFLFRIIGSGGTREKLAKELKAQGVTNVELLQPVDRNRLISYYQETDFLFLHLNDYLAFQKVLPSKIFEYASFDVPMIAGVAGYAAKFIQEEVSNSILFSPGEVNELVSKLQTYQHEPIDRSEFIRKFSRQNIMSNMSDNILSKL